MDSETDIEIGIIEEQMAAAVSPEDAAGAECIACGSLLDAQTGAMKARSPELLESAARALGKGALSGGPLACRRCHHLLAKLRRADQLWRGLRDQLLEVLLAKPPAPSTLVDEHIEFCEVEIKNEADSASVDNYSPDRPDSDSDDEPLYRCKENRSEETAFQLKSEELSCRDSEIEKKRYHKKHKRKSICEDEEVETIAKRTKSKRGADAKSSKKIKENDIKLEKLSDEKLVASYSPEHQNYVMKKGKFDSTSSNTAAILNHLKSSGVSVSAKIDQKIPKSDKKKMFSCNECPSTFTTQSRYDLHMLKHAASKGPFICEVCGASYKHKKACDIHVQMHKGLSPWKCNECGKIFPSKGALSRHEAIHTGTPNYQCDLCGKSFIHTSSFKMHKLSHSGIKPHSCSKCGLALMTKSHLKRHQRVHSGEKRHECGVCGKKFSERYNLYAHQKSHEGTDNQRHGKNYDCTVCESSFNRKHLLEKHMETVHYRVLESCLPKKPRNTMSKLLKQQNSTEAEEIKYTPMVVVAEPKVELVEVRLIPSPPLIDQVNRDSSSNTFTGDMIFSAATSASASRNGLIGTEETNGDTIANHQSWKGIVNYHLTNDYPLRMHGVDYVGYLNRQ